MTSEGEITVNIYTVVLRRKEIFVCVCQFIKDALDNKGILTAEFIDFKSAYDSVWKENLLLKLVRSGIRSTLLQWPESFIFNRACKVRYGEYLLTYSMVQSPS